MIADPIPDWLDREAWAAFVAARKAKGRSYPFTELAQQRILKRLAAFHALGQDTAEIVWKSALSGWSDVYARPVQPVPTLNAEAETPAFKASQEWFKEQAECRAQSLAVRDVRERIAAIKQRLAK